MLNRLKELGIVPKPKVKGLGNRKGVVGIYEDEIVELIKKVREKQASRYSLAQIAEWVKGGGFTIKIFEPTEEYLIPVESGGVNSLISAQPEFDDWLNDQIDKNMPGNEFVSAEFEYVNKHDTLFLKPITIKVKPKEKVNNE